MRPLLTIILQILLKAGLFLGVGSSDCSSPLGMESGAIRDSQISASSSFNTYRNPRLNGNSEWRADVINQNQWLQVDLQNRAIVSGIQTQGRRTDTARFVTSFTVSYSDDGTNWTVFTEGADEAKVFVGNNDSSNIQDNTLNPPIIARYIRVNPRTWTRCGYQRCITMRIELLGCDLDGGTTEPTVLSTTVTVSSHIKDAVIGAVAAGVGILIITVTVSIFFVKRQRSSDTDQPTEQENTGTPCNDIQGALLSDDGEYVDTLPSMVTLQEPDTGSVVYYNVHQPRTSNVYENIPPAPSNGHYQELQPAVYQSLQKF